MRAPFLDNVVLPGVLLTVLSGCAACSLVEFEKSPYTPRDVSVVYSVQEDMTFLSWRLGDEANVEASDIELYDGDDYRHVDLERAPYPAEPYGCGLGEQCLQYQVDGRLEVSEEHSPVRTIHEHVWPGPSAELQQVDETFDIEPWPVERNEAVDPGLFDWFEENQVDLVRDFEYQVVDRDEECGATANGDWLHMEQPSPVDYGWVESPSCFAARPDRRDEASVEVVEPIEPVPELYAERQDYVPEASEAPIFYGVLLDLQIASEDRCDRITEAITETVDAKIEQRDAEAVRLDIYLPTSAEDGEEIDNCLQESDREYPTSRMLRDADVEVAGRDTRVVWVYVNNAQIPPPTDLLDQLAELDAGHDEDEPSPFWWGIGHGWMSQSGAMDATTGWRSIDDETFEPAIETTARGLLPPLTMEHDDQTEVAMPAPGDVEEPRSFKVCTSEPGYEKIGNRPGEDPRFDASSPAIDWPDGDELPFFTIGLGEQYLVPYDEYVDHRVAYVVEACARFCDQPFRTGDDEVYGSWKDPGGAHPQEVCKWSE